MPATKDVEITDLINKSAYDQVIESLSNQYRLTLAQIATLCADFTSMLTKSPLNSLLSYIYQIYPVTSLKDPQAKKLIQILEIIMLSNDNDAREYILQQHFNIALQLAYWSKIDKPVNILNSSNLILIMLAHLDMCMQQQLGSYNLNIPEKDFVELIAHIHQFILIPAINSDKTPELEIWSRPLISALEFSCTSMNSICTWKNKLRQEKEKLMNVLIIKADLNLLEISMLEKLFSHLCSKKEWCNLRTLVIESLLSRINWNKTLPVWLSLQTNNTALMELRAEIASLIAQNMAKPNKSEYHWSQEDYAYACYFYAMHSNPQKDQYLSTYVDQNKINKTFREDVLLSFVIKYPGHDISPIESAAQENNLNFICQILKYKTSYQIRNPKFVDVYSIALKKIITNGTQQETRKLLNQILDLLERCWTPINYLFHSDETRLYAKLKQDIQSSLKLGDIIVSYTYIDRHGLKLNRVDSDDSYPDDETCSIWPKICRPKYKAGPY